MKTYNYVTSSLDIFNTNIKEFNPNIGRIDTEANVSKSINKTFYIWDICFHKCYQDFT